MQKQAPSTGRIVVAIGFALSCFGLLLYLWITFGGPVPLASKSYRFTAYFPEASAIGAESDVRIGGVSVGKVKSLAEAPTEIRVNGKDVTAVEIEIDPRYAPISANAHAILRQKTLLGEGYVELTSGTQPGGGKAPVSLGEAAVGVSDAEASSADYVPEDGTLGVGQTQEATQIDEIFNALDEETRTAFQRWQANAAEAIRGRGLDFSDALGNLGPFLTDAGDIVDILARQKAELQGAIRDTGTVFEALTDRNDALAGAVVGSRNTFDAFAAEEEALVESFQVLPTFERETRATLERLDEFREGAGPVVRDLIPVARDLSPTLSSLRRLSPHLRSFFGDLGELERVSGRGLPATRETLAGLAPVIDRLDPFLANLNPVIRYLEFQKPNITDFLAAPGIGHPVIESDTSLPAPEHALRVSAYFGFPELLSVWQTRLDTNRGNAYYGPNAFAEAVSLGILPNHDCQNTDYFGLSHSPDEDEVRLDQQPPSDVNGGDPPGTMFAPCAVQGDFPASFGGGRVPVVRADP